jgi:hypothetical protein
VISAKLAAMIGLLAVGQATPDAPDVAARIDRFVDWVQKSAEYDEQAKRFIADQWQQRRVGDPSGRTAFLDEALAVLQPAMQQALDAIDAGHAAQAVEPLQPLCESDDPYVAVNASYYLARAFVESDRYEQAGATLDAPLGRSDLDEYTFHGDEMWFLAGFVAVHTLHYEQAAELLTQFQQRYPQAPERLRVAAGQMLAELAARQPERLGDVVDLMAYAGRRIRLGESGKPVRKSQDRAVELLDKLIEEQEQREQQCQLSGASSGSIRGSARPSRPAQQSVLPQGGQAEVGPMHAAPAATPGQMWGQLPPAERQKVLQALQERFPTRYRELVEQYYRQLAQE